MKVEVVDENGHLHYLEADAHRALTDVGLIWRDGDIWRMAATTGDLGPFPELAICDFCSQRPATWEAEAGEFTMVGDAVFKGTRQQTTFTSRDNWLACETCGALIRAGDRHALTERVLARFGTGRPLPVIDALLALQAGFWQSYRGLRRYPEV